VEGRDARDVSAARSFLAIDTVRTVVVRALCSCRGLFRSWPGASASPREWSTYTARRPWVHVLPGAPLRDVRDQRTASRPAEESGGFAAPCARHRQGHRQAQADV